jgi:hypothetical protein
VLSRNQLCSFWSLQMAKIMQMQELSYPVLMPSRRLLVMIAM